MGAECRSTTYGFLDLQMNELPDGLSIIVPVYNSAEVLPKLVERLDPILRGCGMPFEAVLVNDGSRNNSWRVVCELASRHGWVRGINLMRNYGQHNALLCGIRAARYNTSVTMDDDLQNPPEEIPRLLAELDRGFDVVYGAPRKEQHGLWRDMASILTKLALQNAMGAEAARFVSAFRAFRTHVREAFVDYHSPFVSIDVLLTWGTARFGFIKVEHDSRRQGSSNYTVRGLIRHAMNMLTGFSTLPLQFASLCGFLCTLFGLGVLAYAMGRFFLQGTTVPGFTFLASIIAIFSGAQLFAIGIIGEYLARMHFRMMERPTYAIHCKTFES